MSGRGAWRRFNFFGSSLKMSKLKNFHEVFGLPGGADSVLGDQGVGCQERQLMLDGLANQYAVKRVAVKQW
jgi:hypothetical protein